jgi:predicted amidohydrolase YtcJ
MSRLLSLLTGGLLAIGCNSTPPAHLVAELILVDGRIETVDPDLGEVEALAVRDGRILAVGTNEEITRYIGVGTRLIDLDGKRAIPGFIEGHGHFSGIGDAMQILDLRDVRSWDEVIEMVREATANATPGEWILGRGWHQEKWDVAPADNVAGFPVHMSLSAVSRDNPVSLRHASGHACFFNARAMELGGVTSETADPAGGEVLRLSNGDPSGVFTESAMALVGAAYQEEVAQQSWEERRESIRRSLRLADGDCLSKGVTSFQDAGSPFETIEVMADMAGEGELGVRLWVMVRESNEALRSKLSGVEVEGLGEHHLTVRAIKRTIDGALGSRGAWLHDPYTDLPSTSGLNVASVESVEETAHIAAEHGFQLCVHAIGDRANTEVLDIYERVLAEHPGLAGDHRWRIEHAQHLRPSDIPRFAEMGVVASMQGVHCTSDAPFVVPRLGEERAESGAYVWRSLIEAGALVTNGTDAPVEDVDPLPNYYATVTRRLANGERFYPEQRLSRLEALRTYTIDCARAAFEEDLKGSLTPGKLADIVVLSNDILTVSDDELRETRVLTTIVGGEIVYEAPRH